MEKSRIGRYFVDTWKPRSTAPTPIQSYPQSIDSDSTTTNKTLPLKITSWNSRGLPNSIPNLNSLISDGSNIIVIGALALALRITLTKQGSSRLLWSWPGWFQINKLLRREGLGGVGIIWHCDLDVSVIQAMTTGHICSIRLTHPNSRSTLTVIGVYLPCQDLGIDLYRICVTELEQLVYWDQAIGHYGCRGWLQHTLGDPWRPKADETPNHHHQKWPFRCFSVWYCIWPTSHFPKWWYQN